MIIRIKKHNYVTYNATKGKTNGKRKVSIEYKWLAWLKIIIERERERESLKMIIFKNKIKKSNSWLDLAN